MDTEKRVKLIEEAIVIMKDLIVRHDERLDEAQAERKASNEDFNFKMNALIDAQMRNESAISELREASKSSLQRIENLEDKN